MTELMKSDEAAAYLNLSQSTLAKMRLSGKSPPYIKMGRRVAYRRSDLEEWIESNVCRSTSEYSHDAINQNPGR